jgi:hypothetical protein
MSNAAYCPASLAEAQAAGTCGAPDALCYYATGNCICASFNGGPATDPDAAPSTTTSGWSCISLADGCPTFPPAVGTPCTPSSVPCTVDCQENPDGSISTICDYGECSQVARVCIDGTWQSTGNIECPG